MYFDIDICSMLAHKTISKIQVSMGTKCYSRKTNSGALLAKFNEERQKCIYWIYIGAKKYWYSCSTVMPGAKWAKPQLRRPSLGFSPALENPVIRICNCVPTIQCWRKLSIDNRVLQFSICWISVTIMRDIVKSDYIATYALTAAPF